MKSVWRSIQALSNKMRVVGAVCLAGMTALTCVDVGGRFFKHPVFGSVELVTFMGILAVAFTLPFTHDENGHIGVELFVQRLPRRMRAAIDLCTGLLGFVFFALVTWRMLDYAVKMQESGEVSMNLELPEYLIIFVVGICFVVFTVIILKGVADNFKEMRKK
jgi:TRAP-type C4-dicarboxylate transport system permease small subunit